jgi:hypothetical protein
MNSLFSDTVDKIKRKAMSEMNKWVNENDKWDEKIRSHVKNQKDPSSRRERSSSFQEEEKGW